MDEERMTIWQLLDERIRENLDAISQMEVGSDERKKLVAETDTLMKQQQEYEKINNEYYDRQEKLEVEKAKNEAAHDVEIKKLELEEEDKRERRRIEEKKNSAANEIEEKKLKVDWKKAGIQLGLCLIPLAIKIIARREEENRMYDFEEHGRLTSGVSRQFRLMDVNGKD